MMDRVLTEKKTMGYAKTLMFLADAIGIPLYILGVYFNFDNFKALILFILGAVYVGFKIYYFRVNQEQKKKEKEYDLWDREMDKQERIRKMEKHK